MEPLQAGGSPGPEDTVANSKRPCPKQGERCGLTSEVVGPLTATCAPTQTYPPHTQNKNSMQRLIFFHHAGSYIYGIKMNAINENY